MRYSFKKKEWKIFSGKRGKQENRMSEGREIQLTDLIHAGTFLIRSKICFIGGEILSRGQLRANRNVYSI